MVEVDFAELFNIEVSILELVLRASLIYMGILILMRILPRRTGGELAIMDLIFIFLIADAATYSLGDYSSLSEGFIVIGTLIFWNFLVNWLSFRIPVIEKIVAAPPLQIVRSGKLLKRAMRREFITEAELTESLHKQGLADLRQVKAAYVESDGSITFIPYKK